MALTESDYPGKEVNVMADLSPREREVAWLGAELTVDEIAERLGITPRTAKHHLDRARLKLGVKRKRDLPGALRQAAGGESVPM